MLQLTFNPGLTLGLTLTGYRTTRPRNLQQLTSSLLIKKKGIRHFQPVATDQGRVVRKLVNANPGLKVLRRINF